MMIKNSLSYCYGEKNGKSESALAGKGLIFQLDQ